jgi:hypothetical protein
MKRFTGLLAILALLGTAGLAAAAFETGSLIQVVYKNDDAEVGTDLLNLLTFNPGLQNVVVSPAGTVTLGQFVTTNDWADLSLAFFSYTGSTDNRIYFATTQPTAPTVRSNSWSAFLGAFDGVIQYYGGLGAGSTVVGDPDQPNSYWTKMDSTNTPGQYAGLNADIAFGEATLEALNPAGGFVDMYLYKFERVGRDVVLVPGSVADYTAVLRLRRDGSTVLNPPMAAVAPVIDPIADGSATAGQPYTGPAPSLSQGTPPITWTLAAGPAGMTINSGTGVVSWPNPTTAGSPHTVTIQATNSAGSDQESWGLTVTSTAVAPVIAEIGDDSAVAGLPYTGPTPSLLQGTAPVAWTLVAGPSGMVIDGGTGVVSWPSPTAAGSPHTVTIRAENAAGSDEESWQLIVSATSVAPVIDPIGDDTATAGVPYTGPAPSLSEGTPPVAWTLVAGPSGMTINPSTGVVLWSNPVVAGSPHTVTIRAENTAGSDEENWQLGVAENVIAPVIGAVADELIEAGVPYTGPTPSLSEGTPPVTWTLVAGPAGMTINPSTGVVLWSVPVAAGSPHTVTIQAENAAGSDEESWQLTVVTSTDEIPAPTVNNPVSGGTVTARMPTLSVNNSLFAGSAELSYEFELYSGPNLTDFVASRVVPEGDLITSWFLSTTLSDNATYYWRARATDGAVASNWMSTALFFVNTAGADTDVDIEASQFVSLSAAEIVTVSVEDPDSPIFGTAVRIPPGALSEDAFITIGAVTNPPALPDNTKAIGRVILFGPEGIRFATQVTILIPYTEDDLEEAGAADPSQLEVFTYDTSTLAWEKVTVAGVDTNNRRLIVTPSGFSMYTTAVTVKTQPPSTPPDDCDGGPCFIAAAGECNSEPSASRGAALALEWGLLLAVLLGAALILSNGIRREGVES